MSDRNDGNKTTTRRIRKPRVLVPIIHGSASDHLIKLARDMASDHQILVLGIVPVEVSRSLSEAAYEARELRAYLQKDIARFGARIWPKIIVSHTPDYEIAAFAASQRANLLLMAWPRDDPAQDAIAQALLAQCPCNLTLVRGEPPERGGDLLAVLRPGSHSELALRLALNLARTRDYTISSLRPGPTSEAAEEALSDLEMDQVMAYLPQVERALIADSILLADNPQEAILKESKQYDLMILGTALQHHTPSGKTDPLLETLLHHAGCPLLITRWRDLPSDTPVEREIGFTAISILVDKWFAENTFHASEFEDLERLIERKQQQGTSISLALPALNEEETVGKVIQTIKHALVDEFPLLDEIVLIDSNSTDRTRQVASDLGIPCYIHQELLPQYGARPGKGEALWKSLFVTKGDIILWIDTDIVNIHPRFVYGLAGPLLLRPDLKFIKGFYLRPIRVGNKLQAGGGGRVTELTARPMLNLFYPALSGIIQPLSGEYGGRREVLEAIPFSSGYGVEIGLIIDLFEKNGMGAIGQVDLIERIHHNQPLTALSKMSFAIIQTVIRKLDRRDALQLLRDANRSMKLIRQEGRRFSLEVEQIAERERPPMMDISEYQEKRKRLGLGDKADR